MAGFGCARAREARSSRSPPIDRGLVRFETAQMVVRFTDALLGRGVVASVRTRTGEAELASRRARSHRPARQRPNGASAGRILHAPAAGRDQAVRRLLESSPAGEDRVIVGSSRVDLQACKLEYSIVSPK